MPSCEAGLNFFWRMGNRNFGLMHFLMPKILLQMFGETRPRYPEWVCYLCYHWTMIHLTLATNQWSTYLMRHEYHGLYTSVNQNKNDFSICLKIPSVTARSWSAAGKAFQDAGPEMLKAHRPRLTVRVRGTSSWSSSDDRSRGRPSTVATCTQRRVR